MVGKSLMRMTALFCVQKRPAVHASGIRADDLTSGPVEKRQRIEPEKFPDTSKETVIPEEQSDHVNVLLSGRKKWK